MTWTTRDLGLDSAARTRLGLRGVEAPALRLRRFLGAWRGRRLAASPGSGPPQAILELVLEVGQPPRARLDLELQLGVLPLALRQLLSQKSFFPLLDILLDVRSLGGEKAHASCVRPFQERP